MSIKHASIEFNQQGAPVASAFDDVYFSNQNGLAETHYVFMQNNQLPARWETHPEPSFTIAETGFGTGLNFLVACSSFLSWREAQPNASLKRLHFVSTEKFPLTREDLTQALSAWPDFKEYAVHLIKHYPHALEGCHRMVFAGGQVVLDLWLGDIHDTLPQLQRRESGVVDAWFLDGFAPGKNPQMWTEQLFSQMARLGKRNCTFATFTAAGFVRRGLQAAGFIVEKRKGFGTKRDMLAGTLNEQALSDAQTISRHPLQGCYQRNAARLKNVPPRIAVIGGGMAAANVAYALAQRQLQCEVYCADEQLAAGASGNPQGGFYPQLHTELSIASRIQAIAFDYAYRYYTQLLEQGQTFDHQWCGVLQLGFNENSEKRLAALIEKGHWPDSLVQACDSNTCSQIANIALPYPGVFFPQGGWISPPQLVQALCQASQEQAGSRVHIRHALKTLSRSDESWQLGWDDGTQSNADIVILATGAGSAGISLLKNIPFRMVRGQVEAVPGQDALQQLNTVLCHKGYLTPATSGRHALGSTYIKDDMQCDYRKAEAEQNLEMHSKALANADWINELTHDWQGRAATRCSLPDHQPLAGALPDNDAQQAMYADLSNMPRGKQAENAVDLPNVFALLGLGSRGLTTAPLMAELLVSQMLGEPLPLPQDLLEAVNPNRFMIRALKRGEPA